MKDNLETTSLTPEISRKSGAPINSIVTKEYGDRETTNHVKRFAIDVNSTKHLVSKLIKKIELNEIEKGVFEAALQELKLPSIKTVLVDVFARDRVQNDNDQFTIKKDAKTKSAETHTICLWKKTNDTVTILDPTNASLTSYLEKALLPLFSSHNKKIEIQRYDSFINPNNTKGDRFYSSNVIAPTGIIDGYARDCVDVAIKIAFVINSTKKHGFDDVLEKIKALSNQSNVNKILGKAGDGTLIRDLQSSDPIERAKIHKLLKDNKGNDNDKLPADLIIFNTSKELNKLEELRLDPNSDFYKIKANLGILSNFNNKIFLNQLHPLTELLENMESFNKNPVFKNFPNLRVELKKTTTNFTHLIDTDSDNQTPLIKAAQRNDFEKFDSLLSSINSGDVKKYVGMVDIYGQTALHWAASKGYNESVEWLVKSMNVEDIIKAANGNQSYTALHLAVHSGNNNVIVILLDKLKDEPEFTDFVGAADVYGQTALFWAASKGDFEASKALIDAMESKPEDFLKGRISEGNTALHVAVQSGNIDIVKYLISKNIPNLVSASDVYGQTALHWAAGKGLEEISRLLLANMTPEEINISTKNGVKAISWAQGKFSNELMDLFEQGANALNEIKQQNVHNINPDVVNSDSPNKFQELTTIGSTEE